MKHFKKTSLLLALFTAILTSAEILKTVTFNLKAPKNKDFEVGEIVEIEFTATVLPGYYIYGSDFDEEIGPNPTKLNVDKLIGGELVGKFECKNCITKYDEIFEANIPKGYKTVSFVQKVKITSEKFKFLGSVDGQSCTIEDGSCRIFNHDFTFELVAKKNLQTQTETNVQKTDSKPEKTPTLVGAESRMEKLSSVETQTTISDPKTSSQENTSKPAQKQSGGLWAFLLLSFGAGLLALMTPCVYPMIPMTVTIFTKQKDNKNKWLKPVVYALSIVFIYTLLGVLTAVLIGPAAANFFSTNWVVNLLFFVVFVIFALSFLGLFEITLPSKFVNNVDAQSDRGGWVGIFFMAFTLVLVSFSCTGPITGSLLVRAANGEIIWPILGMASFASAFALPFGLLAFFPSWLSTMPKSGSWLNTVKVSLGFLELALAFKFLSQADLGADWNFLSRDLFIAIHIAISLALSLYLFGIFTIKNETTSVGPIRVIFATFFLMLAFYMLPGLFGAPLKAFSGYLPPMTTQEFNFITSSAGLPKAERASYPCDQPKFSEYLKPIPGLATYFDYKQALGCSKQTGKPLFVDFTGKGCANCRRMEENVFTEPNILQSLRDDFVVVSLYVDFDKELPESEWYVSDYDQKTKKTIGAQNGDLQISKFNNNAQPYYLILDENENMLTAEAYAFDLDKQKFLSFLNEGLNNHRNRKKN